MGFVRGEDRQQNALFPVSLEEMVPSNHACRVIKATPKATGRPPYGPADLLKLYLYGYLHQVRSSRRLEQECHRNVEVMWLLGRLAPDHKTIAPFRKDHGAPLKRAGAAFVRLCQGAGLVRGDWVAVDGSKFQAVASPKAVVWRKDLARRQAALEPQIAAYLNALDATDGVESEAPSDAEVLQVLALLQDEQRAIQAMRRRRRTVENPFAALKYRIFGYPRFLMRGIAGARAEMAIEALVWNLKRAMKVLGEVELGRRLAAA